MSCDLTPSEFKAIEELKFKLSTEQKKEVSIEETIKIFLENITVYRREKVIKDNLAQIEEMQKHKLHKSREAGRDLGDQALMDWITNYAPIWRKERESLEKNGFIIRKVLVTDPDGLHMRPSSRIATIAIEYFCDVFVHRLNAPLPYQSFVLQGKQYVNVRSLLTVLQLGIIQGDELEFISLGARSTEALEEIAKSVRNGCQG